MYFCAKCCSAVGYGEPVQISVLGWQKLGAMLPVDGCLRVNAVITGCCAQCGFLAAVWWQKQAVGAAWRLLTRGWGSALGKKYAIEN